MMVLLWQSCSGSDGENGTVAPSDKPMLQINVFTAGHPMVTRADEGDVNGIGDENEIRKLQIWVFENHENDEDKTDDGKFVAYLEDTEPDGQLHPSDNEGLLEGTYQLVVSNSFAEAKPNVDVFVLANGNQDGFPVLDGNTKDRDVLKNALMNDTYGLTNLVTDVPAGGLPMSGMLKNAELGGLSPVLNVKAVVTVVRMVSKVRFVFSCKTPSSENPKIQITKIILNDGLIPNNEYLFLDQPYQARAIRIKKDEEPYYVSGPTDLFPLDNSEGTIIETTCDTPWKYAYVSQTSQEYEALIDLGVKGDAQNEISPELTPLGKFYLRESDKILSGTISYKTIKGEEGSPEYSITEGEATFSMDREGDFSRNHTWIVFGYFAGSDMLEVTSLKLNPWTENYDDPELYNW